MDGSNGHVHYMRALALHDLGRLKEALKSCDDAVRLVPDNAFMRFGRSRILLDLDRPADADRDCDKAIEMAPWFPNTYDTKADCLARLGRVSEARALREKAQDMGYRKDRPTYMSGPGR